MKLVPKTVALAGLKVGMAALMGAALILPAAAAAGKNCRWYAITSAKQQAVNESKSCGFQGTVGTNLGEWTKDIKKHMTWCETVPAQLWRETVTKRQQELQACS